MPRQLYVLEGGQRRTFNRINIMKHVLLKNDKRCIIKVSDTLIEKNNPENIQTTVSDQQAEIILEGFKNKQYYFLIDGELKTYKEVIANLYTAEEIVSKYFTPIQIISLQRFEAAILSSSKSLGPVMTAVKSWLETVMFESASNPGLKKTWPPVPATYDQASQEAVNTLNT